MQIFLCQRPMPGGTQEPQRFANGFRGALQECLVYFYTNIVERFNLTVLDESFKIVLMEKRYLSVEFLDMDLDPWIHEYDYERLHLGYRNQGRRPWETTGLYLSGTLKL